MKYLFALMIVGLFLVIGCKDKTQTKIVIPETSSDTVIDINSNIEKVVEIDSCVLCDSIYNLFPKDSISFERLYGYPNGSRQDEAHTDIDGYFGCLKNKCFDYQRLKEVVYLGSIIRFDADGPTYLRYNTTNYLMDNFEIASKLYLELNCEEFEEHISFLYAGVENTDSRHKLCKYLLGFELDNLDECKEKVVKHYCSLTYKSHEH